MQGRGPTQEVWRNTVKVERCRYLEASKCKGTCMNLCKLPTEAFFREDLGKDVFPREEQRQEAPSLSLCVSLVSMAGRRSCFIFIF